MLAIIAMLSDIPAYIADILTKVTGTDMSAYLTAINQALANVVEAVEQLVGQIG